MHIRYRVELDESERQQLEAMVAGGTHAVRRVKRAQILLAADRGVSDAEMAPTLRVGTSTVYRTKQRFVEHGLDRALSEEPRPGGKRKLAAGEEALLIATACSHPPTGRARWTLALLASALVRLTAHQTISRATIGPPPRRQRPQTVARKDVVRPADRCELRRLHGGRAGALHDTPRAGTAVVCVDETPQQLIGEVRTALPPAPGQPARHDYEYRRNGTANIFVALDAHQLPAMRY